MDGTGADIACDAEVEITAGFFKNSEHMTA